MYCRNCGAPLKVTDAKCPYCGTLNPIGAEAEYMEKLENLRENTEDLEDYVPEEFSRNLKHHSKYALRIFFRVIGISLTIFLIIFGVSRFQNHRERKQLQKEIAFRQEYFPSLDELYALGDDQKVYHYLGELYEKDGSEALYRWEHEAFYYYYGQYLTVNLLKEAMDREMYSDGDLYAGFYAAMSLSCEGVMTSDYERMSEAELEEIEGFQQESMELLTQKLHLSQEEVRQAYEECCEDGFLSYKLCRKYIEKMKHKIKEASS